MFTMENTQGFNQDELDLMNEALDVLLENGWDEQNASARVNNNWQPTGNTIESLTR